METKSAWASKINWTQAVAAAAALAALFGLNVPDETKAQIIAGITGLQAAATWVLRTFFTKTPIRAQ